MEKDIANHRHRAHVGWLWRRCVVVLDTMDAAKQVEGMELEHDLRVQESVTFVDTAILHSSTFRIEYSMPNRMLLILTFKPLPGCATT